MSFRTIVQYLDLGSAQVAQNASFSATKEEIHITRIATDYLRCNGSSNIDEVGYCDFHRILEILFYSGGIYHYYRVPKSIFNGFLQTNSVGKYFHQEVKGKFGCKRIN